MGYEALKWTPIISTLNILSISNDRLWNFHKCWELIFSPPTEINGEIPIDFTTGAELDQYLSALENTIWRKHHYYVATEFMVLHLHFS